MKIEQSYKEFLDKEYPVIEQRIKKNIEIRRYDKILKENLDKLKNLINNSNIFLGMKDSIPIKEGQKNFNIGRTKILDKSEEWWKRKYNMSFLLGKDYRDAVLKNKEHILSQLNDVTKIRFESLCKILEHEAISILSEREYDKYISSSIKIKAGELDILERDDGVYYLTFTDKDGHRRINFNLRGDMKVDIETANHIQENYDDVITALDKLYDDKVKGLEENKDKIEAVNNLMDIAEKELTPYLVLKEV